MMGLNTQQECPLIRTLGSQSLIMMGTEMESNDCRMVWEKNQNGLLFKALGEPDSTAQNWNVYHHSITADNVFFESK